MKNDKNDRSSSEILFLSAAHAFDYTRMHWNTLRVTLPMNTGRLDGPYWRMMCTGAREQTTCVS